MTAEKCLDTGTDFCQGPVELRPSLTGTGTWIPRCERHWQLRLEREDEIRARYPYTAPADFDPTYAGEVWADPDDDAMPGDPYWY